jgi:hypothetical protein
MRLNAQIHVLSPKSVGIALSWTYVQRGVQSTSPLSHHLKSDQSRRWTAQRGRFLERSEEHYLCLSHSFTLVPTHSLSTIVGNRFHLLIYLLQNPCNPFISEQPPQSLLLSITFFEPSRPIFPRVLQPKHIIRNLCLISRLGMQRLKSPLL